MDLYQTIPASELKNYLLSGDFDVLRIEGNFDLPRFQQVTLENLKKYPPKNKDGYGKYKGVGLQYSDDSNPYYEAIEQIAMIKASDEIPKIRDTGVFVKKNSLAHSYSDFYSFFERHFILTRGRILVAEPDFRMDEHTDGNHCVTLHFPIQTDPKCFLYVQGKAYHLPADGHFYAINVAKPHSIWNQSERDRVHLTFPLTPLHFYQWKKSEWDSLSSFQEMFQIQKKDLQLFPHLKIVED